jgi:hypothetical protein
MGLEEVLGTPSAFLFGEGPVGVSFVKELGQEGRPGWSGVLPAIDVAVEAVGRKLGSKATLGRVHRAKPRAGGRRRSPRALPGVVVFDRLSGGRFLQEEAIANGVQCTCTPSPRPIRVTERDTLTFL